MNSMPRALASRGERISAGWPLIFTVPESREIAPPRIFISVDLPAPFSPINATISPAPTAETDVIERNNPWEPFADSLHFEDWVCWSRLPSGLSSGRGERLSPS